MEAVSISSLAYIDKQVAMLKISSIDHAPPDVRKSILKEAKRIALGDVFGVDHKTDRNGQPIEQGLGSASQPTRQSVEAYRKYCKEEIGYIEHLTKMEKALAEYEARKPRPGEE
jgi:hypothetical protein